MEGYSHADARRLILLNQFRKNGSVSDPRLIEMLLDHARMEIEETLQQWKQKPHIMALLEPEIEAADPWGPEEFRRLCVPSPRRPGRARARSCGCARTLPSSHPHPTPPLTPSPTRSFESGNSTLDEVVWADHDPVAHKKRLGKLAARIQREAPEEWARIRQAESLIEKLELR